ncbi:hypothetical protein [Actinokineospora spheciospongiae]|uniref:hypothetical protein n=1 Tax=Actinokineospora spheciospongiae TaxID=909613 RepID=UPI0011B85782|nr:hypothetical protein [Actinokineospora spheciospongiae]
MTTQPDVTIDLQVEIDHGQLYIYSVAPWANDPDNDAVLRALDDARRSGRWVGLADGLIDLVVPFAKSFDAPLRIEVWPVEPPADDTAWATWWTSTSISTRAAWCSSPLAASPHSVRASIAFRQLPRPPVRPRLRRSLWWRRRHGPVPHGPVAPPRRPPANLASRLARLG